MSCKSSDLALYSADKKRIENAKKETEKEQASGRKIEECLEASWHKAQGACYLGAGKPSRA